MGTGVGVPDGTTAAARLLLVDDQRANLDLLERILRGAGYTDVHRTTDPSELVGMVEELTPELVLLDWHMPVRGGADILPELVERGSRDVSVIVLTADPDVRTHALELGADDFLTKPLDRLEVLLRIRHVLQARQLHQELRNHNVELEARVRQRTAELQAANEALRDLDRMRRDFVAMASHEMRTPLTVLGGFLELLRAKPESLDTSQKQRTIEAMQRNVHRLEHLTRNLLLAARIETGEGGHRRRRFDLCELLHDVADRSVETAEITVDCALEAPVEGDAELIAHAVSNLLRNAERYGQPPITVRAVAAADGVEITVQDQGPGVPEHHVPQLFERFSQSSTGDRRTAHGVGLGLWVSRQVVELQGGRMWYEAGDEAGATFGFFIPQP